jgi:hypothetical protein
MCGLALASRKATLRAVAAAMGVTSRALEVVLDRWYEDDENAWDRSPVGPEVLAEMARYVEHRLATKPEDEYIIFALDDEEYVRRFGTGNLKGPA